jgi:DNA-binding MarR family transcriptional regulator
MPQLEWGSHIVHFFNAGNELRDLLVPYFKAGLEHEERCLWVTGRQFTAEQARSALRAAVPDVDRRESQGQIEITDAERWYAAGQKLVPGDLVRGLLRREQDARLDGYEGLRTHGNCAWVAHDQLHDFLQYEGLVQKDIRQRRMLCMCSYCMDQVQDGAPQEIMERHDLALPAAWSGHRVESARANDRVRREHTSELAITQSPMQLLHRAGQCADEIFQRGVPEDVTPRQLAVLLAVAASEGSNQVILTEVTRIDRSTLADIVRRLVKRKLLQRRRTRGDTRAYSVRLTNEGRQVLQTVAPFGESVDRRILAALPENSRQQFIALLQTLVKSPLLRTVPNRRR